MCQDYLLNLSLKSNISHLRECWFIKCVVYCVGSGDGLHSLRGAIRLEWETEGSPSRGGGADGAGGETRVWWSAAAGGRALVARGAALAHCGRLALASALRRAATLRPALTLAHIRLPTDTPPHLVKVTTRLNVYYSPMF